MNTLRILWAMLTNWERAAAVILLLNIFGLGLAVGTTICRHGEEARIGRTAYFLALKMHELHRSQH